VARASAHLPTLGQCARRGAAGRLGEVGTIATPAGDRKLLCFCAVLGWSRWKYVRFFTGQRFPMLAQGLAGCFAALGGVPTTVLFDKSEDGHSWVRGWRGGA